MAPRLIQLGQQVKIVDDSDQIVASFARDPSGDISQASVGGAPDVTAPPPSGDTTGATDFANLTAAIAVTPVGGSLLIPGDSVTKTNPYYINAPLVVSKSIVISGRSLVETYVPTGSGGALNHPNSPGVSGSVIQQVTAATDVLQLSGSAISVGLFDLGLTFAAAIKNTNTGHGVNAFPSLVNGSGHDTGLVSSEFHNVIVYGHDGNHYAFQFRNFLYCKFSRLHAYGGGGIYIDCDSFVGNFGNAVFDDTYIELINAGSANGYTLSSRTGRSTSAGHLNLMQFSRCQVNITNAAATAGTQYYWRSNAGAALPSRILVDGADFEGTGANPVDAGGIASGTVIRKLGILNTNPVGNVDNEIGFQQWTTPGTYTFVVPDGVHRLRVRCVGGGGGGGGGGTNAAAAANTGGGGGGAAAVTEAWISVVPYQSFTVTVAAGGTAGTAGASGGNAGGTGGVGGQSSFGGNVKANGGGGGAGGPASATTSAGGGLFGRTGTITTASVPGTGGPSQSPNGNSAYMMPPGVVGGGAGGASSTTLGGGGGTAGTLGTFPEFAAQAGGNQGASGTASGLAGATATTPGSGGGGGGGAPSGGTGGAGGAGAGGMVEVTW